MNYEMNQLSDLDIFFFYGEKGSDLDIETQSDILAGIIQKKRSLFYDRQDSSGIPERENNPTGFVLEMSMKFDIVNWIAYRNTKISDGSNGTPDRRVAVSQNSIVITENQKGETDVNVEYIPFANIKQTDRIVVPS